MHKVNINKIKQNIKASENGRKMYKGRFKNCIIYSRRGQNIKKTLKAYEKTKKINRKHENNNKFKVRLGEGIIKLRKINEKKRMKVE